jgi:hypothetical protein
VESTFGNPQSGPDWGFPVRLDQADSDAMPANEPARDEDALLPALLDGGEVDVAVAQEPASEPLSLVSRLFEELGLVQAERNRLRAELDDAARMLAYTEGELKSLWGVLTGHNVKRAVRYATGQARDFTRLTPETDERARIRAKIMRVRTLARRRRWPWELMHRSGA